MQGIWRARHYAAADTFALHLAGRRHAEDGSRFWKPDAFIPLQPGRTISRAEFTRVFGSVMDHHGWRRRTGKLRAQRQLESHYDPFEARLLLEKRHALHRQCGAQRKLPASAVTGQQYLADRHSAGQRSRIS